MSEKKIQIIEPEQQMKQNNKKLNVAAYARVSTSSVEQRDSFINQQKYYEAKIKSNPDYNFVGVFADEAISGTTDKRPNFQRMISLAERNKIDIIYTKSISRFSRNVADLSHYCELLKNHGVNLIFEEDNIELLKSSGTLLLTILGAIAQMEVENTSEHVNWTLQKKMENGELVGQANPLGYDVVDGKLVVNEEEAETVKYIFKRYLEGAGASKIAKELEALGAKTKRNNTKWSDTTVLGIIKNEKYTGKLLQGKTYTVNPIGHKRKDNKGEARSFIVDNNHEAIISLEDWNKAQEIIESRCVSYSDSRKKGTSRNSRQNVFTSKIECAYCGKNFIRRTIHAGTKYEKIVWNCSTFCKQGKASCPHCKAIEEDFIKQCAVKVIQNLVEDTDGMFYLTKEKLNSLLKNSELKKNKLLEQAETYKRNINAKEKFKSKLLDMHLEGTITREEFIERREQVNHEIESIQKLLDDLTSDIESVNETNNRSKLINKLISEGSVDCFNEELFNLIINKVRVGGMRWTDFVDDPKSLHFELNHLNLITDMNSKVINGELVYTPGFDMLEDLANNEEMCSLNDDDTCGVCGGDVTPESLKIKKFLDISKRNTRPTSSTQH